jgi:hypothetical protein
METLHVFSCHTCSLPTAVFNSLGSLSTFIAAVLPVVGCGTSISASFPVFSGSNAAVVDPVVTATTTEASIVLDTWIRTFELGVTN